MSTFQTNLKNFCTRAEAKKKQQKTLTAIITFETISYFNRDLQIAMRD